MAQTADKVTWDDDMEAKYIELLAERCQAAEFPKMATNKQKYEVVWQQFEQWRAVNKPGTPVVTWNKFMSKLNNDRNRAKAIWSKCRYVPTGAPATVDELPQYVHQQSADKQWACFWLYATRLFGTDWFHRNPPIHTLSLPRSPWKAHLLQCQCET